MMVAGVRRVARVSPALTVDSVNSSVATSSPTVPNDGTTTVTITVRLYASDNSLMAGVTPVMSATGSGNTLGTFSASDAAGTATATFKTTGATAHTISVSAKGVPLVQTVVVTGQSSNVPDATKTTIAVSSSSTSGSPITITVQAKDAGNTNITVGGATVTLALSGGTSTGTIGAVTDVGNGTYTAVFTPGAAGTATTVTGTINSVAISGGTLPTITVTSSSAANIMNATWDSVVSVPSTASADLTDNGQWTDTIAGTNRLTVVACPVDANGRTVSTNALQLEVRGNYSWVEKFGFWNSPQVGESRYFRVYILCLVGDSLGDKTSQVNSHHPVEITDGSGDDFDMVFTSKDDGTWPWRICEERQSFVGQTDPEWRFQRWAPYNGSTLQNLTKNVWYCFEWKLTKTATDRYTLDARIRDALGNLLWDGTTIKTLSSASYTLAAYGTGLRQTDVSVDTPNGRFRIGSNGSSAFSGTPAGHYYYYAKAAIGSTGWIGA